MITAMALLGIGAAEAQDGHRSIVGWGDQVVGGGLSWGFVTVAAGGSHSLGLIGRPRGDLNCDGAINAFDIDPFVP
jgi:hypothetical protein